MLMQTPVSLWGRGVEGKPESSDLLGFTKQLMLAEHLLRARRSILSPS